jgi:hypothetical protein
MKIESIEQEYMENSSDYDDNHPGIVATKVIFRDVSSPCILSRLMIDVLGRPGKDNDMELLNSGDRCIVIWTQPQLSLEATQNLIDAAITP